MVDAPNPAPVPIEQLIGSADNLAAANAPTNLAAANEFEELVALIETSDEAVAVLKVVQAKIRGLDKTRKDLKAPSLEAGRRVDLFFNPAIRKYEALKDELKARIQKDLREQKEAQRKQLEEAAKIEEPAAAKAAVVEALAVPVVQAKTRRYRLVAIQNTALIPPRYLVPDMAAIEEGLDEGETIPGVVVTYEERVIA